MSKIKPKLIRSSTIAISLDVLLKGQLSFLNNFFDVIAVSGNDEHLQKVKLREHVRTIPVSMQRQISPLKDIFSLMHLYRIFIKEKPTIVHAITPKAGLLSMIAAYFARVPIRMYTFTGLLFPSKTGISQKFLIAVDRVLCHFATNVYPEGEGVKKDLINYRVTKKPLKVLGNGNVNGIDAEYFDAKWFTQSDLKNLRLESGITETDFVFIFIGRIVKDKGINELVKIFCQLSKKYTHLKLLLVGPFEGERDRIADETREIINSDKNIICTGFVNDVRPYLAASDLLVLPSYREGFPNVPIQAGCFNLPCIVTDISGCNEIIEHEVNGLIIPPKDENSLYVAMERLLVDRSLYLQLKSKARRMIVDRYQQEYFLSSLLNEYRVQLEERGLHLDSLSSIKSTALTADNSI